MLSRTPPMGFNTWNTFGEEISDSVIRETADAMVDLGLRDAGYEYLVIDDCWSKRERDPESGKIVPDENKFPNGMKAVSDYVHSKGLKFGMYSCAGTRTCADYPGSFDHEFLDARTFAEYGADFLKYDFCFKPETANGPLLYRKMGMALKACGREILFSACNWGSDEVNTWIRSTGAHMYRSTGDINDSFASFRDIALSQVDNLAYSAAGCFNDIDMLTVGMYGKGNVGSAGCNDTDYKTQFALWCMFGSPLMLGSDIRKMNDYILSLVTNKNLLRINQDEEARPAFASSGKAGKTPCFVKLLSNDEIALMFANLTDEDAHVQLYFENIGITAASGFGLEMKDAFTDECIGVKKEFMRMRLAAHDCAVYICKLKK
ncbi:MAG: glycoside hydrolase family 27 protein [Clostridiales bacterium]|nr:glycoside hydrolase family 27 protein [Clostridiales bacterium]